MKKKNTFDLSKISFKEVPTKEIKADFGEGTKTYTIKALDDVSRIEFVSILIDRSDVTRVRRMYIMLLSEGLEIEQGVAEALFRNYTNEAVRVADEIYAFSNIFDEAKKEEAANAEKN